jgi:hypothetical protein
MGHRHLGSAVAVAGALWAAATLAAEPAGTLADIARHMAPNTWALLPAKNNITNVFPPAAGHPGMGSGGHNVLYAWSGGAVGDNKLWVWGGGHNDYGGNEVYAFDLGTLTWSRLTDPSQYKDPRCYWERPPCITVDGTPTAAHSYDGVEWIESLGKLYVNGGSPWQQAGSFTPQAFMFDPKTRKWERKTDSIGNAIAGDVDPATGYVLIAGDSQLWIYDPKADKMIAKTSKNWGGRDLSGAWSPDHRVFVDLVDPGEQSGPRVLVWNFSRLRDLRMVSRQDGNALVPTYRGTGASRVRFQPPNYHKAGIVYDPKGRRFAVWTGDATVWWLDPATWEWTSSVARGPAPDTTKKTAGIYGRWRYLPAYDVFLGYNDWDTAPWIYKPAR